MFGKHGKPFLSPPLMDLNYSVTYSPTSNKALGFSFLAFFSYVVTKQEKLTNFLSAKQENLSLKHLSPLQ
jgi:hypothetical protein